MEDLDISVRLRQEQLLARAVRPDELHAASDDPLERQWPRMPSTRRLRVVVHRLVLQRLGSPVDPANPVERSVHSVDLVLGLRPSGSGELIALGLKLFGRVVDRRLPDARPIAEMLGLFWASGPSAPPRPFCVLGCAPALPYVEPASSPLQPSMFFRAHRVADTRTEVFEEHVPPFRHLGQGPRRRPAIGGRPLRPLPRFEETTMALSLCGCGRPCGGCRHRRSTRPWRPRRRDRRAWPTGTARTLPGSGPAAGCLGAIGCGSPTAERACRPCAGQPPVPGSGQRSCEAGHSLVNCSDGRGG